VDAPRAVERHRLVGLDTVVFIYALERDPQLGALSEAVLRSVEAGMMHAVFSSLVFGELLVRPLRDGRLDSAQQYMEALARLPHLEEIPAGRPICHSAAGLRASSPGLRLPDAIHLATAREAGATGFVTNDKRLPAVAGLTIIQLSDLQ
jgi:predicted nucleic acid-binding protein